MKRLFPLCVSVLVLAWLLMPATQSASAAEMWIGTVVSFQLNVRTAPDTSSGIVMTLQKGERVAVIGEVEGEAVQGDYDKWYRTKSGYYVYGRFVSESGTGENSSREGRWLDVSLNKQIMTAMVGNEAIRGAEITIGRAGWETPPGTYQILRRVANETMDSATIGIPRDTPDGYYLTDVLYTQYYTEGGHALHYNYWVEPDAFGNLATSRGCIGLKLDDAKFFWDFADVGTDVVIHR